tara:strand:+ start:188 stop:544 length:357 start_codon:yes stop_codon:yes gene_type:complete
MATKDDVVSCIKNWMKADKELKLLQKEIKNRRENKKKYSEQLVEIMKDNEIDSFDISEGKIMHTQSKVRAPLSKQHLIESLEKYFANDPSIEADQLSKFIMDSRGVKVKDDIRHKPPK